MRTGRAKWLLAALTVSACNAFFGIEEGTPRREREAAGAAGASPSDAGAAGDASLVGGAPGRTRGGAAGAAPETTAGSPSSNAGAPDGVAGQPSTCDAARWPDLPERNSPGPDANLELVFAAKSLQLADTRLVGRDIDRSCTCPDAPTCTPGGEFPTVACDDEHGSDVVGNELLGTIAAQGLDAFSEQKIQEELALGKAGLLLRIRTYNGLANDRRVNVEVFGKVWLDPATQVALRHDGLDEWSPYADSVVLLATVDQDINAYVRDYMLVANLTHLSVALRPAVGNNNNPFVIELKDAVLSGKLVPGADGFTFESGNVAGRWPTKLALKSFSVMQYPGTEFICGTNPRYQLLKDALCQNADVMSERAEDNTQSACDGISFAAGFEAERAQVGPLKTPPMVTPVCPANWNPSCFD